MIKKQNLSRTLLGVGGARLFNLPGVIYPKEMLITKVGLNQRSGKPYRVPQSNWGVTSNEAAKLLHCTPSAARSLLHRHRVPFRIVGAEGQSLRFFWNKKRVQALVAQRLPIAIKSSLTLIDAAEAQRILGVGRSTLYRYERRGKLNVTKVRCPSPKGLHPCTLYIREDVERLAQYLHSLRPKQQDICSLSHSYRSRKTHPSHDSPSDSSLSEPCGNKNFK